MSTERCTQWLEAFLGACHAKLGRAKSKAAQVELTLSTRSQQKSASQAIWITVAGPVGELAILDCLHTTDTMATLRDQLCKATSTPSYLHMLSLGARTFYACDDDKTVAQLGIKDGSKLNCSRIRAAEFAGHLYALTELPVDEDTDIEQAVRVDFGSAASVADFAQLDDVSLDESRDDFIAFLEALGPFVSARVDYRNYSRKQRLYLQKGSHRDYHCIHGSAFCRPGAFHPMHVLVYLGRLR